MSLSDHLCLQTISHKQDYWPLTVCMMINLVCFSHSLVFHLFLLLFCFIFISHVLLIPQWPPCSLSTGFGTFFAQLGIFLNWAPLVSFIQTITQDWCTRTLKSSSLVWIMPERLSVASVHAPVTVYLTISFTDPLHLLKNDRLATPHWHHTPVSAVITRMPSWLSASKELASERRSESDYTTYPCSRLYFIQRRRTFYSTLHFRKAWSPSENGRWVGIPSHVCVRYVDGTTLQVFRDKYIVFI